MSWLVMSAVRSLFQTTTIHEMEVGHLFLFFRPTLFHKRYTRGSHPRHPSTRGSSWCGRKRTSYSLIWGEEGFNERFPDSVLKASPYPLLT